jgi:hypothetical protein
MMTTFSPAAAVGRGFAMPTAARSANARLTSAARSRYRCAEAIISAEMTVAEIWRALQDYFPNFSGHGYMIHRTRITKLITVFEKSWTKARTSVDECG